MTKGNEFYNHFIAFLKKEYQVEYPPFEVIAPPLQAAYNHAAEKMFVPNVEVGKTLKTLGKTTLGGVVLE